MDTKIQITSQTKKEAWLTYNQRMTNLNTRLMAGANLDSDHISDTLKRQLLSSCSCGRQLDINERNEMSRKYTCKKRFCRSCCRYMAWDRNMAFYPSINKIVQANRRDKTNHPALWLVTLTLPTCEAGELESRLSHLQSEWRYMYKKLKKEDSKGYVNGLRKLEINANKKGACHGIKRATKHTDYLYHAHLHVLIQGLGNAQYLKRKWLQRNPEASKSAQDITRFNSQNGTLCELLKYLAKPVAKGEGFFPTHGKNRALAFIYDKLRGRRTIFSYGTVKRAQKFKFNLVNGEVIIQHGNDYELAFDESEKHMQDKLVRYINNEKAQASRPLEESIWRFYNGTYTDTQTGELLCTEQDIVDSVKEADELSKGRKRKKKKEGEATKMDAYIAERRHFDKAHTLKIGEKKESIESLNDKVKRLARKKKQEEREYLGFRLIKNKPQGEP